jgi:hypothetical protein
MHFESFKPVVRRGYDHHRHRQRHQVSLELEILIDRDEYVEGLPGLSEQCPIAQFRPPHFKCGAHLMAGQQPPQSPGRFHSEISRGRESSGSRRAG